MDQRAEQQRYPRITRNYAKSLIVKERIFIDDEMSVVICVAVLQNEQRVVGTALVANKNTFDPKIGTAIARGKVIDQIIQSELYQLRTLLHSQKLKEVGDAN